MKKTILMLALASTLLSACATTNSKNKQVEKHDQTEEKQQVESVQEFANNFTQVPNDDVYNHEYTAEKGNIGRGGAALRYPGMIHVLSETKRDCDKYKLEDLHVRELWQSRGVPVGASAEKAIVEAKDKDENSDTTEEPQISDDVLALYKKYCNAGIGMTSDDWERLEKLGGPSSVPAHLEKTCVHPK